MGVETELMNIEAVSASMLKTMRGVEPDSGFADYNAPAAGVKATMTIAAPGEGKCLVVESISATLQAAAAGVTVCNLQFRFGSTLKWHRVVLAMAGGAASVDLASRIVVPENVAFTLEFSAAPGAGATQSVAAIGRVLPKV